MPSPEVPDAARTTRDPGARADCPSPLTSKLRPAGGAGDVQDEPHDAILHGSTGVTAIFSSLGAAQDIPQPGKKPALRAQRSAQSACCAMSPQRSSLLP